MAAASVKVTQAGIEVSGSPSQIHVTQTGIEIASIDIAPGIHVTQVGIEISQPFPPSPTITATGSCGGTVLITWAPPAFYDSFVILRSTVSGGPYTQIGTSTSLTYTDTPPLSSTTYYYVVQTVYTGDYSKISNEATASTRVAPNPPATLTITGQMPMFTITGSLVSGATSYNIYRGTTPTNLTLLHADLATPNYVDIISGWGPTSVYYEFTALNACGEGSRSSAVSWIPTAAECASWEYSECPAETTYADGESAPSTFQQGSEPSAGSTSWQGSTGPNTNPWQG